MTYLSKLWFEVSITSETSIGRAESREIGAQKWKSAELFLNFQKKALFTNLRDDLLSFLFRIEVQLRFEGSHSSTK